MREIKVKWITDRLPTSDDAIYGMVIKPGGGVAGWCHEACHNIDLGEPWHPAFKVVEDKPAEVPWSCPEDIPEDARWFRHRHGSACSLPTRFRDDMVIFNGYSRRFEDLAQDWRWSPRPFSKWEDGNPCTKERKIK